MFNAHKIEFHYECEAKIIEFISFLMTNHVNFKVERKFGINTTVKFECEEDIFAVIDEMLSKADVKIWCAY